MARLDRATIIYPVNNEIVTVGSPLGGNIYFEVPEGLNEGEITLEITGAVRSPFFSAKQSHQTSLEEWRNIERHHPGAWADFESDKFLMQVPTTWIYDYDDPETMMKNYDIAMDIINDLLGKPRIHGTHTMFRQVDVILRVPFHSPGYPMINVTYNPDELYNGKGVRTIFRSPQYQPWQIFHELGHSHVPSFFTGEIESIVNLLSVAVANDGFGMSLYSAFAWSIDNRYDLTLDIVANSWMITERFRENRNMTGNEMKYQHRGHAKYVDVARLFGWDVLNRFYKKISEDYNNGLVIPKTNHPADDRILRMSIAAGADLRPLLHFWGKQPANFDKLADSIAAYDLHPSQLIYDALEHYKSIVPQNLEEGQIHAKKMFPKAGHPVSTGYPLEQSHAFCYESWNKSYADATVAQIQLIQDLYFPDNIASVVDLEDVDKVSLHYNSVDDLLNISNSNDVEMVEIFSITGQLLINLKADNNKSLEISTNMLPSGLYIVQMKLDSNEIQGVKFVK